MVTKSNVVIVATVFVAWAVGGCAQLSAVTDDGHRREVVEQFSRVDQHSSFPAMSRANFEQVNLIELIDPRGEAEAAFKNQWPADKEKIGVKYDLVLAWFRESSASPEDKRRHRDSVQDKILAVSTSRCNVFKTYLRRQQTDVNFLLGSASTISGVLGAVLSGVNSSRNLAGAAGLFSGLRAEYNQAYYSNLAAHVITQGIELQRAKLTKELLERRARLGISEYGMEGAIQDAIYIDGTCSTVAGLTQAQESIKEIQDPGLTLATQAIIRARAMQELNNSDLATLSASGRLEELRKILSPAVSPLAVSSTGGGNKPEQSLARARDANQQVAAVVAREAGNLAKDYDRLREKLAEGKRGTVTGADVRKAFAASATTKIYDVLTAKANGKDGALTTCVGKLEAPAVEVAQTNAKVMLAENDSGKLVDARLDYDSAQAKLRAAVARVERVVAVATTAVEAAASAGRAMVFAKADLTNVKATDFDVSANIDATGLACN